MENMSTIFHSNEGAAIRKMYFGNLFSGGFCTLLHRDHINITEIETENHRAISPKIVLTLRHTHTQICFLPKWLSVAGLSSSRGCSLLVRPPVREERGHLKCGVQQLNRFSLQPPKKGM